MLLVECGAPSHGLHLIGKRCRVCPPMLSHALNARRRRPRLQTLRQPQDRPMARSMLLGRPAHAARSAPAASGDRCVDGIHAAYVIQNIPDWRQALAEVARAGLPRRRSRLWRECAVACRLRLRPGWDADRRRPACTRRAAGRRGSGPRPEPGSPGHLVNATAASAAEANNCRRADLAVIHPRCCHSPASESPAITTSPNGMER
jgi:hypothetical protein